MKILVIEDEIELSKSIVAYFENESDLCEVAYSYSQALEKIAIYQYDCVLLDLSLPGGGGLDILKKLKEIGAGEGVVIISAKHSLDDKISGLYLGADDYLVKPFHLSELKARVIAVIRRKQFSGNTMITYQELTIDPMARSLTIDNTIVPLTRKEYDILLYFLSNKGKVVTKNAIAEHLWGDKMDLSDNFDFIYTHIKNLRKKLISGGAKDHIHSMYGIGYKFEE